MSYQANFTQKELNFQLLIGLKKHLILAQTTSLPKSTRLESLTNVGEVLEYVCMHINEAIPAEEQAIYQRFFFKLLAKVGEAKVLIHTTPVVFNDELGFITTMLAI